MGSTRVAVVQAGSVVFDLEASLTKLEALAREAQAAGARLAVFPEAFLSGYPRGLSFGTVVGNRTSEGRDHYRRYWDSAVDVPGPVVDRLGELASATGLHLVVGVIERSGGTLYCAALFFSPDGYLGKHRKLLPTAAERVVWGNGDGSTLLVVDTPFGRVGSLICWESYMPLLRAAMYAKGVDILCIPTADGRESWLPTMRFVAMEGRCFVLSCNQFTERRDFPDDLPNSLAEAEDDIVSAGGSCIIGPLGDVLAGPAWDGPEIAYADIDAGDIARGKLDFDADGHYARPDVFQLHVDETPRRSVTFGSAPRND
ncbi:MAG: nitrilase-related carbon-nitrogen hydrolase [Jatrophihabitans sp.]|uniref:nitrilase-related carbon-nitrogen hydrolase n=1 Tax=Jatrophihabitans sp. TaxID=1932789 RepID=UPI00390F3D85